MYIVLETATLSSNSNPLINGKVIEVLPVTHDEFMVSYRNPFKKPNKNKAWRMDVSKENSKTTVEIISSETIKTYNVRYISYPSPIIIGDLQTSSDVAGLGLTINGKTAVETCLLADLTHRDIINMAVENAIMDYRENTLEAKVKLNSRV